MMVRDSEHGYCEVALGTDASGTFAIVECDEPGCTAHESVRPAGAEWRRHDLACVVMDFAITDGWLFNEDGQWCPSHA